MAEFCLDCWNKLNHIRLTEEDVTLSEELDFCEGCAEWKQTIVFPYRKRRKKKLFSLTLSRLCGKINPSSVMEE